MKNKIKVAVLMGGRSSERSVSIDSGNEVIKNIDKRKYNAIPILVSETGMDWFNKLIRVSPDVVFIALHGPFGEDGTLQGLLEYAGLLYTGAGVLASALGMDKIAFRIVMKSEKIKIPKFVAVEKSEILKFKKINFAPPYFVKPFDQGSSVGASIAKTKRDLFNSFKRAFKYSDTVLVDELIHGTEVTCGILGNKNTIILPLVEIVPKSDFFDYKSKYSDNGTNEIVPARISPKLTKKVQEIALKAYRVIGCKGFARVDFILKDNKEPIILEINTIPGLTPVSLLPKAAKAGGLQYSDLIDKIISYARNKN